MTLIDPPAARILIVDDTRLFRSIAADLLTQAGFQTAEAASGEEGLNMAAREAPDLILLDMTMPGINGIETCRRLKVMPVTRDVPVIFFSALSEVDQIVGGLEAGASDYVTKPFRPPELLARVRTHVRLKQLQDERLRLYRQLEAELARAGRVQAELLQLDPPALPGFELAARCVPARDVGGDFYSWREPAPGVLTLTFGDVMGKGMPAALLMATVRAAVRAVSSDHQPASALELAVHALQIDFERSGSFVTLFHAQLDATAGCLTYVDAGHGHVFVRRAAGGREELVPGGLPVGILPDQRYRQGSIDIGPGDALVLYSDGLVEAHDGAMLDVTTIADRLDGATSADEMASRLIDLAALSGPPADDLTVLILRRREEG